ncbi:MAG: accessory gene regulator B family protein [Clostridia bacterium]|nr:accessory gene regulator B family protein [Clostridia bacterium]
MELHKVSECLVSWLEARDAIDTNARDVYIYGLSQMIYTALSTTGLLLIGCLFRRGLEAAVLIALFYTNQTYGGGFHADTHARCFLTMVAGECCFFLLLLLPYAQPICALLSTASVAVMLAFPLVLHHRKAYLSPQSNMLVSRSRTIVLAEYGIWIGVSVWGLSQLAQSMSAALLLCALSRTAAILFGQGSLFR